MSTQAPSASRSATDPPPNKKLELLTGRDRAVLAVMVIIPALFVVGLVWLPALISVLLSFTRWNGIGPVSDIDFVGVQNYVDLVTIYPSFFPAVQNNLLWLVVFFFIATPLGMFMAVLLDREIRGSVFYQSALYLPVVLSLALIGFIWQLIYSNDQGLLNAVLGTQIDWFGDADINIYAVLVAASWRHVGYIMLLYLAGLKGVDPALREAAAMDGASEARTFFSVIFPAMRPINVVVLVITVIEALRAFDIVWVINKGRNGLELLSSLTVSNVIGEASRVGFGSAIATIMLLFSLVFIVIYMISIYGERENR
ncbi:carbohydrate ABC transporter permease [Ornithinimicrobium sp. INDO-MA30-4]|uniref:carbohydrate ABC transporter permease n=1 Tax=Ornithinimicrobium sp. INDO-MA30-4 TaxID=2908651 RepID=UPI001F2DD8D7|nr:sugar ABC transporter permease [Ornithinimicrobium sp. INDO-MA30-4]UJH69918.1 sugar ABC transporter permease [Ornithinimicrobium sp. INDO-MA30-4]